MMTRMSAVGPERISSGLTSVIRESTKISSSSASRREKLLGISPPLAASSPLAIDPDSELREEDIWGGGVEEEDPPEDPPNPKLFKSGGGRHWLLGEPSPLGLSSISNRDSSSSSTAAAAAPRKAMKIPHQAAVGGGGGAPGFEAANRHQSAPVNIPDWGKILGLEGKRKSNKENSFRGRGVAVGDEEEDEDDEGNGGDERKLPPHELIAREYAKSHTAFSVYEGAGRTLKGMDLSRVRNAVWKQTGFMGG